ncbi:MAG: VTT domain-containing protein [Erysipelotrichia bacterium]|nr:VTT domain-containing protein [Erysipelotrichia bacterium]
MLKQWLKKAGPWAIIAYIALRIVATIFLSFMPATSMIFDLLYLAALDYIPPILIFLTCVTSVVISSVIMDLIGRFGGSRLIIKLIGQKDYEEASELVQQKGMVYVPFMYLLPLFPDDAICMIAGSTKMNFFVHFLEILLCRGVACATIIFGVQIIPPEITSFTSTNPLDYIRLLTAIVAYLFLMLNLAKIIDQYLTKKLQAKKQNKLEELDE